MCSEAYYAKRAPPPKPRPVEPPVHLNYTYAYALRSRYTKECTTSKLYKRKSRKARTDSNLKSRSKKSKITKSDFNKTMRRSTQKYHQMRQTLRDINEGDTSFEESSRLTKSRRIPDFSSAEKQPRYEKTLEIPEAYEPEEVSNNTSLKNTMKAIDSAYDWIIKKDRPYLENYLAEQE